MKYLLAVAGLGAVLLGAAHAPAGEKTVTLAVDNMFCASCPYIVKRTLARAPGVNAVEVSFKTKTAVVTFDDSKTDASSLASATERMGFPSRPIPQGG